jgi:hypothetical protein
MSEGYIQWQAVWNKYFPYLRRTYREKGKVKSEAIYLGKDLAEAEKKLRLVAGNEYPEVLTKLLEQLHQKQPNHLPLRGIEEKAKVQLERIASRYTENEKVQQAVKAALSVLEATNGPGSTNQGN